MRVRGKTIVVTGAGGFVGRAVCARLLAGGVVEGMRRTEARPRAEGLLGAA